MLYELTERRRLEINFGGSQITLRGPLRVEIVEGDEVNPSGAGFTAKERELFDRLMTGITPKEAAFDMGISLSAVKKHTSHILRKMRCDSVAEMRYRQKPALS